MRSAVVQPEDFNRRSFIYHKLRALRARFGEVDGAAVALAYGAEQSEAEQASHLALAELSPLRRIGFKGPGVMDWLAGQGLDMPAESNRAAAQEDGSVAARLSPNEMILLGDLAAESGMVERLQRVWQDAEQARPETALAFIAPRQDSHAWFGLAGSQGAAVLAKLCAVDLRPVVFDNGSVAQTSVARLGAVIIRNDLGSTLNYHILADSAAAAYLWDCLLDAMGEFSGKPVGLTALRSLNQR